MQHPQPLKQGRMKRQCTLNTTKGTGDHEKLHQMPLTTASAAPKQSVTYRFVHHTRTQSALTGLCLKEDASAGKETQGL